MTTTPVSPASQRDTGLAPVTGESPGVLILGSFPGRRSLQKSEYYGNPQNHFWKIIEELYGIDHTLPYPVRADRLVSEHVALWDVIASCRREGSTDARIRDPIFNDLAGFLKAHPSCRCIGLNGTAAGKYYHAIQDPDLARIPVFLLPSTSPANTRFVLAEKVHRWEVIRIPR
ncbi:MAG: DNA-deoxyinosine glycosylase [Methanoregula sp.]